MFMWKVSRCRRTAGWATASSRAMASPAVLRKWVSKRFSTSTARITPCPAARSPAARSPSTHVPHSAAIPGAPGERAHRGVEGPAEERRPAPRRHRGAAVEVVDRAGGGLRVEQGGWRGQGGGDGAGQPRRRQGPAHGGDVHRLRGEDGQLDAVVPQRGDPRQEVQLGRPDAPRPGHQVDPDLIGADPLEQVRWQPAAPATLRLEGLADGRQRARPVSGGSISFTSYSRAMSPL